MSKANDAWVRKNIATPNLEILRSAGKMIADGQLIHEALYNAVTDDAIRASKDLWDQDNGFGPGVGERSQVCQVYVRNIRDFAIAENFDLSKAWAYRSTGLAKRRAALLRRFITACERAGAAIAKQKAKEAAEKLAAKAKARKLAKKEKAKQAKKPKSDPGISLKEIEAFRASEAQAENQSNAPVPVAEPLAA